LALGVALACHPWTFDLPEGSICCSVFWFWTGPLVLARYYSLGEVRWLSCTLVVSGVAGGFVGCIVDSSCVVGRRFIVG
jgi:hypothetical protein